MDIEDLTARLAAADHAWSHAHGDPPAEPAYIRALARLVLAFQPPLTAGSPAAGPGLDGAALIAAERRRQVEDEGYDAQHDDRHTRGQLRDAALCYAAGLDHIDVLDAVWPWSVQSWHPHPEDRVRELAKAGALICAEIDRLQRAVAGHQGDDLRWREFLSRWHHQYGQTRLTVRQLRCAAGPGSESDPWAGTFPTAPGGDRLSPRHLARLLLGQANRWRGDLVLRSAPDALRCRRVYWVHRWGGSR